MEYKQISKEQANYRQATDGTKTCLDCSCYIIDSLGIYNYCKIVEGYINPMYTCDYFGACRGNLESFY